ncbi:hypothetical protein Tco_1361965 [Tanacetum coccineum]
MLVPPHGLDDSSAGYGSGDSAKVTSAVEKDTHVIDRTKGSSLSGTLIRWSILWETDKVKLIVDVRVLGKSVDEIVKETVSFGDEL